MFSTSFRGQIPFNATRTGFGAPHPELAAWSMAPNLPQQKGGRWCAAPSHLLVARPLSVELSYCLLGTSFVLLGDAKQAPKPFNQRIAMKRLVEVSYGFHLCG